MIELLPYWIIHLHYNICFFILYILFKVFHILKNKPQIPPMPANNNKETYLKCRYICTCTSTTVQIPNHIPLWKIYTCTYPQVQSNICICTWHIEHIYIWVQINTDNKRSCFFFLKKNPDTIIVCNLQLMETLFLLNHRGAVYSIKNCNKF